MGKTLPLPKITVRLKETVDVLSDPGLMSQIAESQAFYKTKRKGLSFEKVFGKPLIPPKKRHTE